MMLFVSILSTLLNNSVERAYVRAKLAAVALCHVDKWLAVLCRNGGTARFKALPAAAALVRDNAVTRVFNLFKKGARTLCYYNGRFVLCNFFFYDFFEVLYVERICDPHGVDAYGFAQKLKVYLFCRFAADRFARCGVVLMSRHSRYGVVENDNCVCTLVVDDIN